MSHPQNSTDQTLYIDMSEHCQIEKVSLHQIPDIQSWNKIRNKSEIEM